jgi:uncharacterized membrane protein YgdD (TMEM256/DUF423 family)
MHRLLVLLAGLAGAAGVAFAAAAAHGAGGQTAASAALVLLAHAPALLALGLRPPQSGRWLGIAGLVLALGTALFAADMAMRQFAGHALLPMAAPAGGVLMIAGWLAAGACAASAPRRS